MEDEVFFNSFVTKSLHPIDGAQRFFEGYLTVQVKDKQGEITIVDELIKVLPVWMDRGAPISDTHSNRIIGKGISYAKTVYKNAEGEEYPAIKITGKIHKDYQLDNEIWDKIKSGEYKGLSFGGATKANRTPKIMKDGSVAYELKSLEHYEVAVCKEPAVPLALITDYNPLAKAVTDNVERREDGKMVIKCDKFGCTVKKDSLVKIEDDEDDNTQVTVLDEWKNETHPDKNGKTEGIRTTKADIMDKLGGADLKVDEKGRAIIPESLSPKKTKYEENKESQLGKAEDLSNADGDKTNLHNQDAEPDKSSNRETSPVNDSDDANIEPEKKEKAELQQNGSDVRYSGKEYQTNNESAQVTEVKEDKEKSGYVTEDGNKQAGGQGSTNDDTYKNSENYINSQIKDSDKDMEDNKSDKELKDDKEEQSSEEDKVEKSHFEETIKSNIDTLTDVIKSLAETQKDVSGTLENIDSRLKALETPTDLPLKPATSDEEDIGADVKVPDTYQSNSIQAGLDDDKSGEKKPEGDQADLKMQEKSFDFTTETPRPNAAIEAVNKSSTDLSLVLKDAREGGDLSAVARDILAGKYYTPTPDEVGMY